MRRPAERIPRDKQNIVREQNLHAAPESVPLSFGRVQHHEIESDRFSSRCEPVLLSELPSEVRRERERGAFVNGGDLCREIDKRHMDPLESGCEPLGYEPPSCGVVPVLHKPRHLLNVGRSHPATANDRTDPLFPCSGWNETVFWSTGMAVQQAGFVPAGARESVRRAPEERQRTTTTEQSEGVGVPGGNGNPLEGRIAKNSTRGLSGDSSGRPHKKGWVGRILRLRGTLDRLSGYGVLDVTHRNWGYSRRVGLFRS